MIKTKEKRTANSFMEQPLLVKRGQIVIPSEARKAMDLKGEKTFGFGMG